MNIINKLESDLRLHESMLEMALEMKLYQAAAEKQVIINYIKELINQVQVEGFKR